MTVATMPRCGAVTLSDVREPTLAIVCKPCDRRGRYSVERLMAEHGDAKLTDLLQARRLPQGALGQRPMQKCTRTLVVGSEDPLDRATGRTAAAWRPWRLNKTARGRRDRAGSRSSQTIAGRLTRLPRLPRPFPSITWPRQGGRVRRAQEILSCATRLCFFLRRSAR